MAEIIKAVAKIAIGGSGITPDMGEFVREILHVTAGDTTVVIDCNAGGDTSIIRYCSAAFVQAANDTAAGFSGDADFTGVTGTSELSSTAVTTTLTDKTGTVSDGTCELTSGAATGTVTSGDGTCAVTDGEGEYTSTLPYVTISTTTTPNDTVTINGTLDGGEYFVELIGRP